MLCSECICPFPLLVKAASHTCASFTPRPSESAVHGSVSRGEAAPRRQCQKHWNGNVSVFRARHKNTGLYTVHHTTPTNPPPLHSTPCHPSPRTPSKSKCPPQTPAPNSISHLLHFHLPPLLTPTSPQTAYQSLKRPRVCSNELRLRGVSWCG
jgi:hypothetical protein